MEFFSFNIPLWAVFLGIILAVFVIWKLFKFAIKVLLVIVVFFIILIGLDMLDVFTWIQKNIIATFL